jgi:hypothetical protein
MAGLAAALVAAAPAPAATPLVGVKVSDCRTGADPEQRLATFEGTIRTVTGASRMAMRFELLERAPSDAQPQSVDVPKLSKWQRSEPGVRKFVYAQTVRGLAAGVTYRSIVYFRWYDAKGRVIRRAERLSGTCVQDGKLPNLVMSAVKSSGGPQGTGVYTVTVANTGAGDAKSFGIALILDGALVDSRTVDLLKAGDATTLKLTGPLCRRLRAVVDRGDFVTETVEEDNELRARC